MFSRKTILELVKALNFKTHDQINRFRLTLALDDVISPGYMNERETSIAQYLVDNPDAQGPQGGPLALEIVEYVAEQLGGFEYFAERNPTLVNSLERDGFALTESGIRRTIPSALPLATQEDELLRLLDRHQLNTARGHYEQAIAAHARGDWAASNSQLRTFVEEFFRKAQDIISPGNFPSSHEQQVALAKAGFFVQDYNEYLCNGKGFVEGFWKRLHPQGSHPGLSEQADATFRLHLVILVIHYFIVRLDKWPQRA